MAAGEGGYDDNAKETYDSEEAETAGVQALTVLKEFYAKAGESTAFVQRRQILRFF